MADPVEIVERVARATRQARFERTGRGKAYDPLTPLHETELADARAAIEETLRAIREPDEAMVEAGFRARLPGMNMGQSAVATWQAMIDECLKGIRL